ncbi:MULTISPECIES: uracil-xanthine permease family protein [Paraclostridium]|uniref:uracil-xanthine permease family protein n=1 Tax=Paraclostridium TaxID=1849822 RepID=UPI000401EA28|nr:MULTISPECIES: uracil-xanthine permease family protein [Paraclostridium]MDV8108596.1 uracil-xanthine permease family protein [Bacillus sp. BAU-SS-2023]MCU9813726.1 uracil-xanthine permease family protein [Paraclostridium sp. AKS73]TQO58622.1 uracil-xanthine permease [Paraclostridium bifermentans]GKZ03646.1 ABC transporter permease [Paraclostridium bifermentans]GKZ05190.1 ABC transporter permease [Paraclostridium bifermentans]
MKKTMLSLQHLLAMFGATVLVPILTGFNPAVAIFCAGVGTLIFHACTKGVVPVFLGSSFAFIPVIIAAKEAHNGDLAYAQGGIIVAGIIYLIMAAVIKKVGVDKIKKYFPAQVVGAMIAVIGLNLLPTAVDMASNNFLIAIMTLGLAIAINVFCKGFIKQLNIIIAVAIGYTVSLILGNVDISFMSTNTALLQIPQFTLPKFSLQAIVLIAPVVLAVFMEHIGDMTTNGTVVGKNFIEEPGLHRTLMGDALATIMAGFLGGPANTTYGENTAVLAITKNYDPSILRRTAICAILLACVSKFGGFLQSIPTEVMGGISIMLFSMISYVGLKTINDSKCVESKKNIIIIATIMVIGLGTTYLSNKGIVIGIPVTKTVTITGLSLAAIVGIILNRVLNKEDFKKDVEKESAVLNSQLI